MALYDTGYEDELFQHPVGPSFHCGICYNVVKNPVMCRHNEHLFCRACITRHLMNSQTCPSCLEPLTVDTLSQPSRTVMNLLSELKIHCHFFNRGCEKFIELGNLDRHVADCGFAPAVCSNEGCRLEVNKQDLLHHETSVCELRRVQCHSCNDIRQEMDVLRDHLATVNVKLSEVNEKFDRNEKRVEELVKENMEVVKDDVIAKVELVQEQLKKQEESNRQLKADNVEMKKSLNEITKQLERMTHEVQGEREHEKKGISEAAVMDREPKVVVGGGYYGGKRLNFVEMLSLLKSTWAPVQPMKVARNLASSVFYNNHIFVVGGYCDGGVLKSIEKLSMNAIELDQSITWENCPAELPRPLYGHCSVVYNGRLITIGGYDKQTFCDSITEISLDAPYASKVLATMPQTRWLHCIVLIDGKIVVLGGRENWNFSTILNSVLLYDIAKNECKELAPLPYPASKMAAVKWGDDNVILVGGVGSDGNLLNKVLMYNIKTQTSYMLPDMKYFRAGCVAVVIRDTVIVMGGQDERQNYLKSVECFKFDRFTWEELPEMREARRGAFAVVC